MPAAGAEQRGETAAGAKAMSLQLGVDADRVEAEQPGFAGRVDREGDRGADGGGHPPGPVGLHRAGGGDRRLEPREGTAAWAAITHWRLWSKKK